MRFVDLHCDTISVIAHKKDLSLRNNDLQIDLNKLFASNYLLQVFAIFTNLAKEGYQDSLRMIKVFKEQIQDNEDLIQQITTYTELVPNKLNALLSIEDLGIIENNLSRIDELYDLGVRIASLTWNYPNSLGYPNRVMEKKIGIENEGGLTAFGFQVLRYLEQKGIIVDVSHLSDAGFWDVYNASTMPFIASHSNCRSITNHPRNLTDDMIKALAERQGVIGINFCTAFVNENASTTTVEDLIKHIDYIKDLVGVDFISLGTDFDGIRRTTDIDNASEMEKLIVALEKHGYRGDEIEKICYRNFLRVFAKVCR